MTKPRVYHRNETATYFISSEQGDTARSDPSFLGDVQSNFLGTEWSINGHALHNADAKEQMGVVLYASNVLGSRGPRQMKVFIPEVVEEARYESVKSYNCMFV